MSKWTRNQKILIATLVVMVIFDTIYLYIISQQQEEININLNEIKADIGDFEKIITSGIYFDNLTYPSIQYNDSHLRIKVT